MQSCLEPSRKCSSAVFNSTPGLIIPELQIPWPVFHCHAAMLGQFANLSVLRVTGCERATQIDQYPLQSSRCSLVHRNCGGGVRRFTVRSLKSLELAPGQLFESRTRPIIIIIHQVWAFKFEFSYRGVEIKLGTIRWFA